MIIKSDWHIHSQYSYDASNSIEEICEGAKKQGLVQVGITDHLNFNNAKFIGDIKNSAQGVKEGQKQYPFMNLGVELTAIAAPEFDYIAKHGSLEGYIPPAQTAPYEIRFGLTKEELKSLGIRYAIGAAHWRVDIPPTKGSDLDLHACLKEWHRQQLFLSCDERVTILGHPWWNANKLWYEDFSIIPRSMHEELASALKENGKFVECNRHFFTPCVASEKLSRQYAEFLREMFEKGIPVTYGSDSHGNYCDEREFTEKYLRLAGFKEGDFSELSEKDLW